MIFGECPYDDCGEPHFNSINRGEQPIPTVISDDTLGDFVVTKHTCTGCKRDYFIFHSRINPAALTAKDFKDQFEPTEEPGILRFRNSSSLRADYMNAQKYYGALLGLKLGGTE